MKNIKTLFNILLFVAMCSSIGYLAHKWELATSQTAYEEGMKARKNLVPSGANPYTYEFKRREWLKGWIEGSGYRERIVSPLIYQEPSSL